MSLEVRLVEANGEVLSDWQPFAVLPPAGTLLTWTGWRWRVLDVPIHLERHDATTWRAVVTVESVGAVAKDEREKSEKDDRREERRRQAAMAVARVFAPNLDELDSREQRSRLRKARDLVDALSRAFASR